MESTAFPSNLSTKVPNESWFIPFDIFRISCTSSLSILFATFFLIIIITDKTCRTVPMMLVANSCFTGFLAACSFLGYSAFTLHNDLKQIDYQDSLCIAQAYFKGTVYASFNYSFVFQSLYRYVLVVYPTRLVFQSFKFQGLLICTSWIINSIFPFPFLLLRSITYDVNNQICMIPFRLSFSIIYFASYMYLIPMTLTKIIYFKLIRYVHGMNKRVTPASMISRAERELKMVQRTIILVTILLALGSVLTIFVFMSFFTPPPKYYFRIGFILADLSLVLVMIVLYQFTDPLKTSIRRRINAWKNRVVATT